MVAMANCENKGLKIVCEYRMVVEFNVMILELVTMGINQ